MMAARPVSHPDPKRSGRRRSGPKGSGRRRSGSKGSGPKGWGVHEILLLLVLVAAVVFGGAPNGPGWRMAIILLLSSALMAWALGQGAWAAFRRLPRLTQGVLISIPLLWVVHLVPLPSGLWAMLPGREVPRQIFELTGTAGGFHPLSVMPRHTLFGLVTLLPACAVFAGALCLDERGRNRMVVAVLALVLLAVLVGLVQLASQGGSFNFYNTGHRRYLIGFFANRNHQGLLLAMGGVFAVFAIHTMLRGGRNLLAFSVLASLALITAAVGSLSRSGLMLTLGGLAAAHLLIYASRLAGKRLMVAGGGALGGLALLYTLSLSPVVERILARYDTVAEDGRWEIWQNAMPLIDQYFPWGSGMGSFAASYRLIEPLEHVDTSYLNHFHNDYLEWLAEAGLPGLVILLLLGLVFVRRVVALRAMGWWYSAFAVASALALVQIALHSIVDYPLRTQAIAVLAGLFLAFFLVDCRVTPADKHQQNGRSRL